MIKGVNKKIIEVNNPDSLYFERAVFYLRPEVSDLPDELPKRETDKYIENLGRQYGRRKALSGLTTICLCTALVAVIGAMLYLVIYAPI